MFNFAIDQDRECARNGSRGGGDGAQESRNFAAGGDGSRCNSAELAKTAVADSLLPTGCRAALLLHWPERQHVLAPAQEMFQLPLG